MSLFAIYVVVAICIICTLLTCVVEVTDCHQSEYIRFIFAMPIILIGAVCILELFAGIQKDLGAPAYYLLVSNFSEDLALASIVQNLV